MIAAITSIEEKIFRKIARGISMNVGRQTVVAEIILPVWFIEYRGLSNNYKRGYDLTVPKTIDSASVI